MRIVSSRLFASCAVAAIVSGGLVAGAGPASAVAVLSGQLLDQLTVVSESSSTAYSPDYFGHWVDADGDGCGTGTQVLLDESQTEPTLDVDCSVTGVWTSWMDGRTWTDPDRLTIDHLVPLEEAWTSGAAGWSADQRRAYANDLGYVWSLNAVTDTVAASRGSGDPAEWMPPAGSCTYASSWIGVKYRWHLSVDPAEKSALAQVLAACGAPVTDVPVRADVPDPAGSSAGSDNLAGGEQLTGGQWLMSADRTHGLAFQTDGNLVAYGPNSRVLWSSHTYGHPGAVLKMQADGNAVIYAFSGRVLWNAGTYGNPGATLKVQNDGNVVIYRSNSSAAWFTGWDRTSLFSGQDLDIGQQITSANGRYQLILQRDGNVVVYQSDGRPLFFTGSYRSSQLRLQLDGNLVVYNFAGVAKWNSHTSGGGFSRLDVQDDGNVVLYRADGRAAWYSGWDTGQWATSPSNGTYVPSR